MTRILIFFFLSHSTWCFILLGLASECGLLTAQSFNVITNSCKVSGFSSRLPDSANKNKEPMCSEYQIIKELLVSISWVLIISTLLLKYKIYTPKSLYNLIWNWNDIPAKSTSLDLRCGKMGKWQIHIHLCLQMYYSKYPGNEAILDAYQCING